MTAQAQQSPYITKNEVLGRPTNAHSNAYFQYMGQTGLTVVGSVSGKRYRFDRAGAIVSVDAADRRSLASVPKLRQVRRP